MVVVVREGERRERGAEREKEAGAEKIRTWREEFEVEMEKRRMEKE